MELKKFLSLFIILCSTSKVWGGGVEKGLADFHKDPHYSMEKLADQIINGKVISRGFINYKEVKEKLKERNRIRKKIIKSSNRVFDLRSKVNDNDQATMLVENQSVISQIFEIDKQGLMNSSLAVLPWADSYWPIYKGLLGVRYADHNFPDSKLWIENYNYILAHPASSVLEWGNQTEINNLSPAEKYDLLVGDSNMTMTKFSWAQGQYYMDQVGTVETWMGICHGWAGAAHMFKPVLERPITLSAPNGRTMTFYQSDVKALLSMLWANSSPAARFIGTVCKKSKPDRDVHGRVQDPACLDTNPGTFFLALTNQLGFNQRSFVMDATYDAEIWNFPIASYQMTYFNPQTLNSTGDLKQALIPMERFRIDKFRSYRSPEAKYIVGIASDITYVIEINPTHAPNGKPPTKTLRFIFDLELDGNYNVIGGEWYMNAHPDFLWTYRREAQAVARGESALRPEDWIVGSPIPEAWGPVARRASAAGSPLYSVVKRIIEAGSNELIDTPIEHTPPGP